ncbi:MAG: hypothetical protein H7096_10385 [Flavobacterium sp.]|nr:hypothetical protein [Pedobacter sp.]
MDLLRKIFGLIWMITAVFLAILLPYLALGKFRAETVTQEDYVFWIIIITIFIPIIIGFMLFGFYAFNGNYNNRQVSKTKTN